MPFIKGRKLAIVVTDRHYGTSPKVSVTEVIAFSDLRSEINKLSCEVELFVGSDIDLKDLKKIPFICLGGPSANPKTKVILDSIQNLPVSYDESAKNFLYCGASYKENVDPINKETLRDYGLIVYLPAFEKDNISPLPAMIIFGIRGVGTQGAISALINMGSLRDFLARHRKQSCYAFLEFNKGDARGPCKVVHMDAF